MCGTLIFALWAVLLLPIILAQQVFDLKRDFGAKGNNVVADTLAFQKASDKFNVLKSAILNIPKDTYLVSGQEKRGTTDTSQPYWYYKGVFNVRLLTKLTVNGNGATIKLADGLRYGAFDSGTGLPYPTNVSLADAKRIAHAGPIFQVWNSTGVTISSLNIDGNLQNLVIGNRVGDLGIQASATGFVLDNCPRATIKDSTARNCGLDGFTVRDTHSQQKTYSPVTLLNVVSEYNGRQGLSWIGGNGLTVTNSRFSKTGRATNKGTGKVYYSAPGSGIDLEPNPGKQFTTGGVFTNVIISDNVGSGLAAAFNLLEPAKSPNNDNTTFNRCTFEGTTKWAAWIFQPGLTFRDCTFLGRVKGASDGTRVDGTRDPKRATKFIGCTFKDSGSTVPLNYLVEISNSSSVSWTNCVFKSGKGRSLYLIPTTRYPNPPPYTITGCKITHDKLDGITTIATFKGVNFSGKTVFNETAALSAAPASLKYNMPRTGSNIGDTTIVDATGKKPSTHVFWWPRL